MMTHIAKRFIGGVHLLVLVAGIFGTTAAPSVLAQDEKGCEGVQFVKRPYSEYSPARLKQRLERDAADVDALLNLGSHEEEQGNLREAEAFFDKAIRTRPDCYLGYYFAGLIRDRLSRQELSRSEADIRKALTLNPDLRTDGNIEAYINSHRDLWGVRPVAPAVEEPWRPAVILARANHFFIGLGAGLFLGTVMLAFKARARGRAPQL